MKTWKKVVYTLLLAVVIAGLGFIAYFGIGSNAVGSMKAIKLGLDLAGGVSITYETVEPDPSAQDMEDTIFRLQKRVDVYSTEAEVYKEGNNRINVEIPDVTDANAILEELGQPGSLLFLDMDGNTVITGSDIKSAEAVYYQDNYGQTQYAVSLVLTDEGSTKFSEATTALVAGDSSKRYISIVYNGEQISAPYVREAITNGSVQIDNLESVEYAQNLASTIRIGAIPLELTEIRSNVVGAKLGQDAIRTSLIAGAIGLVILFVFMIVIYRIPGLAASLALIIYTLLVTFILSAYELTLTLSGIAGIILSIGMAVDANVIIFARIGEELDKGKSVRSAIQDGFKKALSAILDGNITTLIATAVLALKGTGTIKGFAVTLAIGIVVSMFTAIVITKSILVLLYELGFKSEKFYGVMKKPRPFNFVKHKMVYFTISAVLIIGGFVCMGVNSGKGNGAFNYSLEFVGGTTTTVTFNEDYTQQEIEQQIIPVIQEATGVTGVQQQKVTDSTDVIFKTASLDLGQREAFATAMEENFGVAEDSISAENISATVGGEMRKNAIVAVVIAVICMLIYIWFRFSSLNFAGSAIIALVHDVLIVIGFYAVSRISVGNTFIACVLTILGYSINATIVIFDRIRENRKEMTKASLEDVVNASITQTLSRSINTSLTTFVMLLVLYILGVSSIKEFVLPLIVGVICGAYSSVFLSGTIWYSFEKMLSKKKK